MNLGFIGASAFGLGGTKAALKGLGVAAKATDKVIDVGKAVDKLDSVVKTAKTAEKAETITKAKKLESSVELNKFLIKLSVQKVRYS